MAAAEGRAASMPDLPSHPTLLWGVIAGLAAAAASAVSYLLSRHYAISTGRGSLRLLVLAHVVMGAVCLPLAWLLSPATTPPLTAWLPACLGSAGSYLLGQAAVFAALRRADASRVSPLLGLKVAMLALVVSSVVGQPLDARQWLAVGLSGAAAALLQRAGSPLGLPVLALVAAACLLFAISDLFILTLIDALQPWLHETAPAAARLHAGALAMAVTYAVCGLAAVPLVGRLPAPDRQDWVAATQYAAAWLAGMVGLYACFGLVGVVLGNILQSTRGLISVGLGAVFAACGWHDLEQPVDRITLAKRFAAGLLMTAAILVSVTGR